MRPLILITRPSEHADQTARDVEALGFDALACPVLELKPRQWIEPAWDTIRALIITSRTALASFAGHNLPKDKPVFAVGQRTAEASKAEGFSNIQGIAETSAELPALIPKALPPPGLLLHLASEDAHTSFYQPLRDAGYTVDTLNIYKAEALAELPENARKALLARSISGILFYSPRSCTVFLKLLQHHGLNGTCQNTTAFCLSEAVDAEARAGSWKNILTAEKPTHESLMERLAKTRLQGHHPNTPDRSEKPMPPASQPSHIQAPAKAGGRALAAIALLFAFLAVALSGYTIWLLRFSRDSQARQPEGLNEEHVKALVDQTVESRNRSLNEGLSQLTANVEKLTGEMEKQPTADARPVPQPHYEKLQAQMVEEQKRVAGLLGALTQLDLIENQLHAGRNFHTALAKLKESLPETVKDPVKSLEASPDPLAGDDALLQQLRSLEPAIAINAKIKDTPSMMDKISLEMQKLVVIRPKDETALAASPQQQASGELRQAIAAGDWEKAETLCAGLAKNAPEGFAVFQEALKVRAAAEKNIAAIRAALFDALKSGPATAAGAEP